MRFGVEVPFHTQIVEYLDGCNMECMSLLLGLCRSTTFSSSLIMGDDSDGIFITFKASFCETFLGNCLLVYCSCHFRDDQQYVPLL